MAEYILPIHDGRGRMNSYANTIQLNWKKDRPQTLISLYDYIKNLGATWDNKNDVFIFSSEEEKLAFVLKYS